MIHAPQFNGKDSPLDINIRTKIRYEYSYIESAVLHLEGETFEVGSFGDYFLNGVSGARLPAFIAGYPITHSTPSEKVHVFEIKINNIESIIMKTFKDMVSVGFEGIDDERLLGSLGMVGSFNMAGKLIGRDGETEFEDPNAFADEWQIRQDEPMWFNSVYGPQHPQKCKLPGPTKTKGRRLGETLALEAAEKACAKYASENQEACVHDVMAIGDLDLASSGAF